MFLFNLIFFSVLWQLLPHYMNPCLCKPLIIVFLCHNVGEKNITWEANSLGKYSVLNFQSRAFFLFSWSLIHKKATIWTSNDQVKLRYQYKYYPSITNNPPPPFIYQVHKNRFIQKILYSCRLCILDLYTFKLHISLYPVICSLCNLRRRRWWLFNYEDTNSSMKK